MDYIYTRATVMTKGPNLNGDVFTDEAMEQMMKQSEGLPVKLGLGHDAPTIGKINGCAKTKHGIEVLARIDPRAIQRVLDGDFIGWMVSVSEVECSKCHARFKADSDDKCECLKSGEGNSICNRVTPEAYIYHRGVSPADVSASIESVAAPEA